MKLGKHLKTLGNIKIKDLEKYLKDYKSVILIALSLIAITILLETLFFYRGIYFAPKKSFHNLSISSIEPESKKFTDIFEKTEGLVLIDKSHGNNFGAREIETLMSRISSRNNKVEFLENADSLEATLRRANSFVVILPTLSFTEEETDLVKQFSSRNGKLLLAGDPDRQSSINSVANKFSIMFSEDYLFNLRENDGNFRFIFLKDFARNEVTKRLDRIAFYAACPILPVENGIAFTDKDTFASSLDSGGRFAPVVFLNSTLALCDITFLDEPFNSAADNNRLISNIADFLTKKGRKFDIADFPHFFKGDVAIVTTNLDLSGSAISLKSTLSKSDINANIKRGLNTSIDAIAIGLFDDFKATPLENLAVDKDSFRINELLFDRKDSSLIHLSQGNVTVLTILSDSRKTMEKTLERLKSKGIRENLIDDNLAVVNFESEEEGTKKQ